MEVQLEADEREGTGKGVARKLRASGQVPAVLYGHGMDPVSVSVNSRELYHVLHTGAGANVLVDLHVGSKKHLVLAREIQRDHIRGELVHVDFLAIRRDEKIHVDVPISIVGESPGVKQGGVVEHHLWEISAECLPADVPESVEVDISRLEIGDSFRVEDLGALGGLTILTPVEETILSVVTPQVLEVEEVAAEGEVAEGEVAEGEVAEGEVAASAEAPASEEGGGGEG
ncbi:MAG: 50S ribosomal protein L25 [Actinomycetota bacterium]|nr:50S ribosomal protein L25 [Actinomycetota bacterium]